MCCTMMLRKVFATCVCACPCCMSPYKNLFSHPLALGMVLELTKTTYCIHHP